MAPVRISSRPWTFDLRPWLRTLRTKVEGLKSATILLLLALVAASIPAGAQTRYAKGQDVVPAFEGWERNADGSFNMVFGYMNRNYEEEIDLPVGPDNMIEPGPADQGQPTQSPYSICFPVGCMADYQVTDDLIGKMKKGQNIIVQAINMQGTPISLPLPLNDFAKAYDGPPTDPKAFEEQQRKLQEELQKKAEEARKKLEGQQSQAPAAPAPAPTQKK